MLDLKPDERVLDVGCGIGVSRTPECFLRDPEQQPSVMLYCGGCCA